MFKNNKGFTIIELIVVVAIIAVLAAIVSVNVSQYLKKTRNARRLIDIENYAKAFVMVFDQTGEYPDPGDTPYHCLGDYEDDTCAWGPIQYYESPTLNDILDDFIGLPTEGYTIKANTYDFNTYLYKCGVRSNNVCSSIVVNWLMEGTNQSCGVGVSLIPDYDGSTFCQYIR